MRVLFLESPRTAALGGDAAGYLQRLAPHLERMGVEIEYSSDANAATSAAACGGFDLIHLWNVRHPGDAEDLLRMVGGSGLPVGLSYVYEDPRRIAFARSVQEHLAKIETPRELEEQLEVLARGALRVHGSLSYRDLPQDPWYRQSMRRMLAAVDAFFPLTCFEEQMIEEQFGPLPEIAQVSPVAGDSVHDPECFRSEFDIRQPYLLLPGFEIGPNGNQWLTLHALRRLAMAVVVTGHFSSPEYEELCRQSGPKNCIYVGGLPEELMASALAGAEAVVLTGHAHSAHADLCAIQAAAAHGSLVVSDTGMAREVFLGLARTADPFSIHAIEDAVQHCLCGGAIESERRRGLVVRAWSSTWEASAGALLRGYRQMLERPVSVEVPRARTLPHIHFRGAVLGPSGFAGEGREWLAALEQAGLQPSLKGTLLGDQTCRLTAEQESLISLCGARPRQEGGIAFHHSLIPHFEPDPRAELNVLHTIFETEGLPEGWADSVNRADLVLVLTEWNRQTFAAAGVEEAKLRVLPPPFDPVPYDPLSHDAGRLDAKTNPGDRPCRWLSMFDWQLRKGHDLLLEAFAQAFGQGEAELWLKVMPHKSFAPGQIEEYCAKTLLEHAVKRGKEPPAVKVVDRILDSEGLLDLYRQADAFVLASRGEAWGRPVHEAMLMQLPVVASHGSALATLVPDESVGYPVRSDLAPVSEAAALETPFFRGQLWHEPSVDELARSMRAVVEDFEEAHRRARLGRQHILELCNPLQIAECLGDLLLELAAASPAARVGQ